MKWANPLSPAQITGQQTLTDYAPVTKIHRAVQELQNDVVAAGRVTINGVDLDCSVRDNTLEISGEIPAGGGAGSGLITVITGVTPKLEVSGSTLTIRLQFDAVELDLASMTTSQKSVEDATDTITGVSCE